jgi:hypothetical protein
MMENAFSLRPNSSQNRGNLNCPNPIILDLFNQEAYPGFNPHRYIHKELSELGKEQTLKSSTDSDVARMTTNFDGIDLMIHATTFRTFGNINSFGRL